MSELASAATQRGMLALAAVVLAALGPTIYYTRLSNATIRETGWPAFALLIVATVLAIVAFYGDKRLWVRSVAIVPPLLLVGFTIVFFPLSAVSKPQAGASADRMDDFALLDDGGKTFTLSAALAKGPVYIVFYRGFW